MQPDGDLMLKEELGKNQLVQLTSMSSRELVKNKIFTHNTTGEERVDVGLV